MLPELGLSEILLIGVVALVVLRPADVPEMMRKIGVFWVQLRANWGGIVGGLKDR